VSTKLYHTRDLSDREACNVAQLCGLAFRERARARPCIFLRARNESMVARTNVDMPVPVI